MRPITLETRDGLSALCVNGEPITVQAVPEFDMARIAVMSPDAQARAITEAQLRNTDKDLTEEEITEALKLLLGNRI